MVGDLFLFEKNRFLKCVVYEGFVPTLIGPTSDGATVPGVIEAHIS